MQLGRGATKALVEETTHNRAPRIETDFMVAEQQLIRVVMFERYAIGYGGICCLVLSVFKK
jgi:hypothetical protein